MAAPQATASSGETAATFSPAGRRFHPAVRRSASSVAHTGFTQDEPADSPYFAQISSQSSGRAVGASWRTAWGVPSIR
ncbi:hypothetical protein [Streptomyces sp. NPDC014676]|uniref:hypothetical protein n=1 Tax=Streptomyces sp. NPDC014676 TaxID=3364879 RepID=UPI0036F943CE